MNSLRFRLIFLTLLIGIANAQQPAKSIFAGKSTEELRRIAEDLGEGKSSFEFVEAAYASGRDDIVAMCWSVRTCGHWCFERLINNKDPEFRDKQLLMMLRNGKTNSFWPDGGGGLIEGGKAGMLIKLNDLVKNYIPDWPANYAVVDSPEKRLAFADKLEALMKAKQQQSAKPAPSPPPARLLLRWCHRIRRLPLPVHRSHNCQQRLLPWRVQNPWVGFPGCPLQQRSCSSPHFWFCVGRKNSSSGTVGKRRQAT